MTRIRPSPTGETLALATRLKAEGRDVISLAAGEPDFDTPAHIRDAAVEAIRGGETRYTPIEGTLALRLAIQRKFSRDNGLKYTPSGIIVTAGAKQALYNLCLALLNPGDEVIIPAPYWVSYPDIVALAEGKPVILHAGIEQDFKITPKQLESAITPRCRLFIFNSPSNPTGTSYTRNEIEALGAVLERFPRVVVASDEIYEHIQWSGEPFNSFAAACPALADRVVTVNGVSKAYAMTGWRIGFAAGPENLISAMTALQSQSTSNPCSVSQAAAIAALDGDQSIVAQMTRAYRERLTFLVPALNEIAGVECRFGEGTFYAFPRIAGAMERLGIPGDAAFTRHILDKANVALVPGSAFGAPGHIRLSFACSPELLRDAVGRIARALAA